MARAGRTDRPLVDLARAGIAFLSDLIRRRGAGLVLAFACIALPLWAFGELAEEVLDGEPFAFDEPLLHAARALDGPTADGVFLALSAVGFAWGVIPVDIALTLFFLLRRRFRDAGFVALATGGSGLLNMAAKHTFQRERPALWDSIAPEATYSFPSGHAMGSATLACVLAVLAWRTRWRVPVLVAGGLFAIGVGLSRVYLGVHYPSDILAGWVAAGAWTFACAALLGRPGNANGHPSG